MSVACGGGISDGEPPEGDGGDSPYIFVGGTSSDGGSDTGGSGATGGLLTGGVGGVGAAGGDGGTGGMPFVEPECPDEPINPPMQECDPLGDSSECEEGLGCYPYLVYPRGERCGAPEFGARCRTAGTAGQGEECGEFGGACAPGFMCVVGALGGKRCGQICEPGRDNGCPLGLLCGATDVKGYGVCF